MSDLLRRSGLDRATSLDDACELVAGLRGRPLQIVEADLGHGVSGLWLGLPDADRIVVSPRHVLTAQHRRHVVAHELVHVLEAVYDEAQDRRDPHPAPQPADQQPADQRPTDQPVATAARSRYDDPTERRVELLATRLMMGLETRRSGADRLAAMVRYR